eukprot:TRINITY_DN3389_c0_g1_i4.p1 TRINITY_DN3389_c0_g1~~TRINITY_DN3389_c0_g1_i4.p1  ORF type:complete len:382 (-),score=55.71 TRINITY_DN3389_c0_g1_i4:164-1309(-)
MEFLEDLIHLEHLGMNRCNVSNSIICFLINLKHLKYLSLEDNFLFVIKMRDFVPFPKLETLKLQGDYLLSDLPLISSLHSLTSLNVSKTNVRDEDMMYIASLRGIIHLNISECTISSSGIFHLNTLSSLRDIDLQECDISDDDILIFSHCQLNKINLRDTKVTDKSIEYLLTHKSLTELGISWCWNITSQIFPMLKQFSFLKTLSISGLTQLDDDCLVHLSDMNLNNLIARFCHFKDIGLSIVGGIFSIKKLAITNWHITSRGLQELHHVSSLDLSLSKSISNKVIEGLSILTSLTKLNLYGCKKISDFGVKHLIPLKDCLRSLNMGLTSITDISTEYFVSLYRLDSLKLVNTRVTKEGIKKLATLKLKELRHSQINQTNL